MAADLNAEARLAWQAAIPAPMPIHTAIRTATTLPTTVIPTSDFMALMGSVAVTTAAAVSAATKPDQESFSFIGAQPAVAGAPFTPGARCVCNAPRNVPGAVT